MLAHTHTHTSFSMQGHSDVWETRSTFLTLKASLKLRILLVLLRPAITGLGARLVLDAAHAQSLNKGPVQLFVAGALWRLSDFFGAVRPHVVQQCGILYAPAAAQMMMLLSSEAEASNP